MRIALRIFSSGSFRILPEKEFRGHHTHLGAACCAVMAMSCDVLSLAEERLR